MADSVIEIVY
jgi:hypothetical protein